MNATCIKFDHSVYSPPNGDPIPMLVTFLDIDGFSDVVKVQLSEKKVEGSPRAGGTVYVDCAPRFGSGGKLYWKPSLIRFLPAEQMKL